VFAGVQLRDGGRGGGGGGRGRGGPHQDAHHEGTVDYKTFVNLSLHYITPLLRIRDFFLSRIHQEQQKGRGKTFIYLFLLPQINRNENNFLFFTCTVPYRMKFEQLPKKFSTFLPNKLFKLLKIWVADPRSGKTPFWVPDPWSRGQKGTGSRVQIRNNALHF
jgi:hypothetical protein